MERRGAPTGILHTGTSHTGRHTTDITSMHSPSTQSIVHNIVFGHGDSPSDLSRQALVGVLLVVAFTLLPWQWRHGPLGMIGNTYAYYSWAYSYGNADGYQDLFVQKALTFWQGYARWLPRVCQFWACVAGPCWATALLGYNWLGPFDPHLLRKAVPLAAVSAIAFPLFAFPPQSENINIFAFALAACVLLAHALRLPPEKLSIPAVLALVTISFGSLLTTSLSYIPRDGPGALYGASFFALYVVFAKRALIDFDGHCAKLVAYQSLASVILLTLLVAVNKYTGILSPLMSWSYPDSPPPPPDILESLLTCASGGLVVLFLFSVIRAASPLTLVVAATAGCHHEFRACDYSFSGRIGL